MNRATCLIIALVALPITMLACSSGDVPVGTSDQRLKKKDDGGATGDGTTCSWDGVVSYDAQTGQTTSQPGASGGYDVGDSFPSPDGCNTCSCTANGIACTEMGCAPKACTQEAKQCPDGSYVTRTGPNCEFAKCPDGGQACAADAMLCPDGSYVSRTGPNCTFPPCP